MNAKLIAAALSLAAAGAVHAVPNLDIKFLQTTGIDVTTSDSSDYLTGGMQYVSSKGNSFEAFCIELAQGHATNVAGLQSYAVGSFSGAQSTLLQGLFSSSYAGVTTSFQKAAFQTAVWEITHETTGSMNADAGSFSFFYLSSTSTVQQDADFLGLASGYLQAASAYNGAAHYSLIKLTNATYQDLVTVTAVPEPESYALMLGGLVAVVFMARRRKII